MAIDAIMSSTSSSEAFLLLGGTGKVASRIAPLLSAAGHSVRLASRSGTAPKDLPSCEGIKFDWDNPGTYDAVFQRNISAIFLIGPASLNSFPRMKQFIDLARSKGVNRFVQLSASIADVGDGPEMGKASEYLRNLHAEEGLEYSILRPTWFMENFSESQHQQSIKEESQIITATYQGKLPFVSVYDIAAVAFHCLTDATPHNTDYLIVGPALWSFDEVAALLTEKLKRKITHVKITELELAQSMTPFLGAEYAAALAQLDTVVSEGKEAHLSNVVERVTGMKGKRLEEYVDECTKNGIWDL